MFPPFELVELDKRTLPPQTSIRCHVVESHLSQVWSSSFGFSEEGTVETVGNF